MNKIHLHKPLITLLLCAGAIMSQAQEKVRYVTSEKKLSLRDAENLKASIILGIPRGDSVKLLYDSGINTHRIAGRTGKMVKVSYNGREGYVFDGFLSINNPNEDHKSSNEAPIAIKEEVKQVDTIQTKKENDMVKSSELVSNPSKESHLAEFDQFIEERKRMLEGKQDDTLDKEEAKPEPKQAEEQELEIVVPVKEGKHMNLEEVDKAYQTAKVEEKDSVKVGDELVPTELLKEKGLSDFIGASEKVNQITSTIQSSVDSTMIKLKNADLSNIQLPKVDSTDNISTYKEKLKKHPKLQKLISMLPLDDDYQTNKKVLIIPTTSMDDAFDIVKVLFDLPSDIFIPATEIKSRTVIENPNRKGEYWFDQLVITPDMNGAVKELTYNLRGNTNSFSIFMIRTNRAVKVHYREY